MSVILKVHCAECKAWVETDILLFRRQAPGSAITVLLCPDCYRKKHPEEKKHGADERL